MNYENYRLIENFAYRHAASIEIRDKPYRFRNIINKLSHDTYGPMVDIKLPIREFECMIQQEIDEGKQREKQIEEERIRNQNPMVANAYSKYKILLAMYK